MVWRQTDPQCNESRKIVWEVAPYLRGRGLDIGAGDFRILPHAITVDDFSHAQFGFTVRPDIRASAEKLDMFTSNSMDFVYSSHTLEHIKNAESALRGWWRLVKTGGYLILYLPHKDFYPNIGQPGANPDHKHDFVPADIITMMPAGFDLVECQERNEDMEYSFLLVFKKLFESKRKFSCYDKPTGPTACVVRYGAFGDLMQATSVWAGLKQAGYHVTVFASPPGSDVILDDPHIDRLVLFDKDQVPNADLGNFWEWQRKKFDKFVNLSESVEGTFLSMPGRVQATWTPEVRHRLMNFNYLEHQHMLAGVPHKPQIQFYPTDDERKWALKFRNMLKTNGPIIMWSLSGSSVHKTWAGMDNIIAGFLLHWPDCRVILVGGDDGVILEQGWENEPRVIRTSGKWSIRQTFSMMMYCNLIVGPETGVMNAASCMSVPKVVLLSHSTVENLTRDWVNTTSIWSKNTRCKFRPDGVPACHMMHFGWQVCQKDEDTSTAQCQADIDPADVWDACASILEQFQRSVNRQPAEV